MGWVAWKITAYMSIDSRKSGFWVGNWKCLRMTYTCKNTTEASSRGSTRPSLTLLHSSKLKAACQSMGCVVRKIATYMCRRFLENQRLWVVNWKCLRVAYASKNTTETRSRGLKGHHQHFCTARYWRRRVKIWVQSLGRSQRICPWFLENQEFMVVHWNAFAWPIHQRTQLRHLLKA